jgi:hypothetical protein
MFEHVQETEVDWTSKAMAGLAFMYVAMVAGMLWETDDDGSLAFYAVLVAVPLLIRGRRLFLIVSLLWALLVLVLGAVGAMAGWFIFWPAALPLLLAVVRLPDGWAPAALSLVTAVLAIGAYLLTSW